ncbi:MAG: hypothetical protein ACUVQR_03500 [Thermogutta sp.]
MMKNFEVALPIYDSSILNTERDVFSMFGKVAEFFPDSAFSKFPSSTGRKPRASQPVNIDGINSIGLRAFSAPKFQPTMDANLTALILLYCSQMNFCPAKGSEAGAHAPGKIAKNSGSIANSVTRRIDSNNPQRFLVSTGKSGSRGSGLSGIRQKKLITSCQFRYLGRDASNSAEHGFEINPFQTACNPALECSPAIGTDKPRRGKVCIGIAI